MHISVCVSADNMVNKLHIMCVNNETMSNYFLITAMNTIKIISLESYSSSVNSATN